jgi:hypothetical protein
VIKQLEFAADLGKVLVDIVAAHNCLQKVRSIQAYYLDRGFFDWLFRELALTNGRQGG